MTIETNRLVIRPFVEDDRKVVECMLMDRVFMEYSDSGCLTRIEAPQRFTELVANTKNMLGKLAIVLKSSQRVIGYCGVEPFNLKGNLEIELGYRLMPEFRGMGFATEAATVILSTINTTVYAYVSSDNVKSINVLGKLGFCRSGVLKVGAKNYELYQYM